MTNGTIHHVCERAAWEEALRNGVYEGSDMDRADGFIHFSGPDQVVGSVARFLAERPGLVILTVEAAALGAALRWEDGFPHLYAPLDPKLVARLDDLPLGDDGRHVFPEGLA